MSALQIGLTASFGVPVVRLLRHGHGTVSPLRRRLWMAVWSLGLLFVWFPELATLCARRLGVGRGADAVMYLAIAGLSWLVFRLYVAVEDLQYTLSRLVGELAIEDSGCVAPPSTREAPAREASARS